MKFEKTQVFNFEGAFRGMRNPKNSWGKSDSEWKRSYDYNYDKDLKYVIGPNDMKLAKALIAGGPEHCKFLRQIFVSVDITAPLYWWKEMDTYKVGTTANSTSTMHKLTSKPITLDCFEIDDINSNLTYYSIEDVYGYPAENTIGMFSDFMIEQLEFLRQKYIETKDKRYWKELVRWLPESWLQTRTLAANYDLRCHNAE